MNPQTLPKITETDKEKYQNWWNDLSDKWKKAINQAAFQKGEITDDLTLEEIHDLWHSTALRFAGPKASFPNLSFKIEDLEGVKELINLKILVAIDSGIKSLKPISKLTQLEGLFVMNNELKTLTGIKKLSKLRQLYIQNNQIDTLEPLKKLLNLEEVFAFDNEIKSLKGISEKHSEKLIRFHILPNKKLPQKEVIKMENKIGIRCLRG